MINLERTKIVVKKRKINSRYKFEAPAEPMKPMFSLNFMREFECQMSAVARLKWKRYDDEDATFRRWFG